jgi:SAM-dependent methyltransferase
LREIIQKDHPLNLIEQARDLFQSIPILSLRSRFIEIINRHQVPYAENIIKTNDWIYYCYYCSLVRSLVPDKTSLIIDWGGLYGHITMILRTLDYRNVYNYLLHQRPHYPLFEEQLKIPTLWGEDPNRLNLESNSVDGFISSGVLEHVREDGQGKEEMILREIHRVLKAGGLFFIWNLPAKLGTSEILATISGKWRHQYRYWKKEIVNLLENSNFEILYLDKHKFFPGAVMNILERRIAPENLLNFDHNLSHFFPFNIVARDFIVVARKENKNSFSKIGNFAGEIGTSLFLS